MPRFIVFALLLALTACGTPEPAELPVPAKASPEPTATLRPTVLPELTPEPTAAPSPSLPLDIGDEAGVVPLPDDEVFIMPTAMPPQLLTVGETATLPDGQTITIHAVEQTERPEHGGNPGEVGLAFDLEWCAGPTPAGGQVQASAVLAFDTVLEDHTRGGSVLVGLKDPAFTNATIAANECNRGWVGLLVPGDKQVRMITFETMDPQTFQPILARWELP